jgi:putative FmdB family regulatory protein
LPTYEYACRSCGGRREVRQRITDDPLTTCETCGGEVKRVLFPVGVVYKGTGFYTTDYARKNGRAKESGDGDGKASEKSDQSEKPQQSEKKEPVAGEAAASTTDKKD